MGERLPGEVVYQGALLRVRVARLPRPQGGTSQYEIVEHPGAVAIVALRPAPGAAAGGDPLVALARQQRPALGAETWELPAGLLEPSERDNPQRAAERELREETGYAADDWRLLTREYSSPGFTDEVISIYLATDARPAPGAIADQPADPTEIAQVRWAPLSVALAEAQRATQTGAVADGKTLLGLVLARDALRQGQFATTTTQATTPQTDNHAAAGDVNADSARGEAAMPRDTPNMPFQRNAPYTQEMRESGLDTTLKLDNMLLEEFNYASTTAYQAMEDRARMFNLYLLLIGVLGSGLAAIYQLGGGLRAYTPILAIGLLVIAGVMGIAFFVKLIRLRQAWRDSAVAMGVIKEYYIQEFTPLKEGVGKAFHWRLDTLPMSEKRGSVTFVVCTTVAILASLCFAGAAFIAVQQWLSLLVTAIAHPSFAIPTVPVSLVVAAVAFLATYLSLSAYFRNALNSKEERKAVQQAEETVDSTDTNSRKQ